MAARKNSFKKGSKIGYVIEALIPFTDANLKLTFVPNAFFHELDRRGVMSKNVARNAYYEARARGLIQYQHGSVALSKRALAIVDAIPTPLIPATHCLMVTFDIPEEYASKRRQLRSLLRELKFQQTQRSVWTCNLDHREIVLALIEELQIGMYAKAYVAESLN